MKMLKFFIKNIIDDIMNLPDELNILILTILLIGLWIFNGYILHTAFGIVDGADIVLGLILVALELSIYPLYMYLSEIYDRYQEEESEDYVKEIRSKRGKIS